MKLAILLIDKAIEICGSAAELARRLQVDRAEVTKLRQGKRPLSPEMAAEIADIAGEDARQAVIDAVIERNAETRKGPVLREILGKGIAAGVAAMLVFSYSAEPQDATTLIAKNDRQELTYYTSYLFRLLVQLLRLQMGGFFLRKNRALAYG